MSVLRKLLKIKCAKTRKKKICSKITQVLHKNGHFVETLKHVSLEPEYFINDFF